MTNQPAASDQAATARLVFRTGALLGIGLVGAADEILFHQLLQWHNFYVHSSDYWRIASDGLFHLFTVSLLFFAAARLWARRRHFSTFVSGRLFWAGVFSGGGGFQLFDGTINHKVLQLHPVREGAENIVPYDVGWIVSGLLLLYCGWLLWRSAPRVSQPDRPA